MSNTINSYTSWQPLEEVIVGQAYTPDYFDFIENPQVRDQLQQILCETAEDLDQARAEAGMKRAEEVMGAVPHEIDFERARLAMLRTLQQMQVESRRGGV